VCAVYLLQKVHRLIAVVWLYQARVSSRKFTWGRGEAHGWHGYKAMREAQKYWGLKIHDEVHALLGGKAYPALPPPPPPPPDETLQAIPVPTAL
jgi:hypothetical protein